MKIHVYVIAVHSLIGTNLKVGTVMAENNSHAYDIVKESEEFKSLYMKARGLGISMHTAEIMEGHLLSDERVERAVNAFVLSKPVQDAFDRAIEKGVELGVRTTLGILRR